MANGRILTVSELAEHLNVHRITIYRLLKNGDLPGFKIGRVWRFDLDEISKWMASGRSNELSQDGAVDGDGRPPHQTDGAATKGKARSAPPMRQFRDGDARGKAR